MDFPLWIDSEISFQLSKFWMECEAILSVVHVKLLRGFQLNLIVEISRSHVPLNYRHLTIEKIAINIVKVKL